MATVPNIFANRSGSINLSDLDADFAAFQASGSNRGGSLVAFIAAGSGAVATTQKSKSQERPSVLDFMNSAQRADVLAKTFSIDVADAINAALLVCKDIDWPEGGYLVGSSIKPKGSQRMNFKAATIQAFGAATNFSEIKTGGTNAGLGLYTIFDMTDGNNQEWDGKLSITGNSISDLCGIAAAVMNGAAGGINFNAFLSIHDCAWGIYGQTSTNSLPGTFTGGHFGFIVFGNSSIGDVFFNVGNDDIDIGLIRTEGLISLNNNTMKITNLFLHSINSGDGFLSVGSNCNCIIDHCFVEGNFDDCIVTSTASGMHIRDLQISPSFSSTTGAVIRTTGDKAVVDVDVSRAIGGADYVVARLTQTGWTGNFTVRCPYPLDMTDTVKPQPYKLNIAGGAASTLGVMKARMSDADYTALWSGSVLSYTTQVLQTNGEISTKDQTGALLANTPRQNTFLKAVVNTGSYSLDDCSGDVITLNSANAAATIFLIGATIPGRRVRLSSSNSANNITVSGASGVGILATPGTPYALLPNLGNAICFAWDGTNWREESRVAY